MSAISGKITIRQLLNHTSGLADVFNDTTKKGLEEHPEHPWTTAEVLKTIHAPWYQPGEGWAYANTNYLLLGLAIERITGSVPVGRARGSIPRAARARPHPDAHRRAR